MQHVFAVVTDTSHVAGLNYHSQILAHMFALLENKNILVPLAPQVQNPAQNIEFVQQHIFNLMKSAYGHLQEYVFLIFFNLKLQSEFILFYSYFLVHKFEL